MTDKIKSNAIKALILFFVISAVSAIAFRFFGGGVFCAEEELDEFELRFAVKDISSNSVRYFIKGDTVSAEGGFVLGRLEKINEIRPTQVYVAKADGNIGIVGYPENSRVDVYGTISTRGKSEGGFYLYGVRHIASGDSFLISTERLDVTITVTEIVKK